MAWHLMVHRTGSKEPLLETYGSEADAKEALRELFTAIDANRNGFVVSKGGGIAIKASEFSGAEIREIRERPLPIIG